MEDLVKRIDQLKIKYETLKKEIARKIVGQEEIIEKTIEKTEKESKITD